MSESQSDAASAFRQLLDDLRAEREVIDRLLTTIPDDGWDVPSPAEGWTLRRAPVAIFMAR